MLLWLGFAVLSAAVAGALLRPLFSGARHDGSAKPSDMAVYRDQLTEIEADRERGLISSSEAESARTEIARRLLSAAEKHAPGTADGTQGTLRRQVRDATAVLVPLAAIALYLNLGSPGLPQRPFVAPGAKPLEMATREELVAMVEQRLRSHPEDGKGWDVIAPIYVNQGRFAEAADAYKRAIALLGETPARLKGQAEATILVNNGLVTEEARKMFERVLELEPGSGEARFALALAKEQDGKLAEAADEYRRILDTAPADARWKAALEVRLARLVRGGGTPTAEAAEAASMSKDQRDAFILAMVERLAARLKTNGNDLAGWQQLVRSYKVLGREADASAALGEARRQFKDDAKALGNLDAFAKSIGMGS
jgi:cytochrome c-type biogenesis protein CcmH